MLNMYRNWITCLVALLLVATASSCGAKSQFKDSVQVLERSVRSVCSHVRWGNWDKLGALIRFPEGDEANQAVLDAAAKPQPLEVIKVINCDTLAIDAEDSLLYARAVAEIEFHTSDTVSIRKLRYVQNWWKDEETGRWHLGSPLPDFCGAMGGKHASC